MNWSKVAIFAVLAIALLWAGYWYNQNADQITADQTQTDTAAALDKVMSKLIKEDLVLGQGPSAKNGDLITVNYIGTLAGGEKFDSSYDRKQPFDLTLGASQVIAGWDLGLLGMQAGGKRKLTIPPELGYGSNAVGPIPANSTLIFEVELLKIN